MVTITNTSVIKKKYLHSADSSGDDEAPGCGMEEASDWGVEERAYWVEALDWVEAADWGWRRQQTGWRRHRAEMGFSQQAERRWQVWWRRETQRA